MSYQSPRCINYGDQRHERCERRWFVHSRFFQSLRGWESQKLCVVWELMVDWVRSFLANQIFSCLKIMPIKPLSTQWVRRLTYFFLRQRWMCGELIEIAVFVAVDARQFFFFFREVIRSWSLNHEYEPLKDNTFSLCGRFIHGIAFGWCWTATRFKVRLDKVCGTLLLSLYSFFLVH